MAWLRIQRKGKGRYYQVVRSERRSGKVISRVVEYLGRDPDPKRLQRALDYWGVKPKPGKGGRRG